MEKNLILIPVTPAVAPSSRPFLPTLPMPFAARLHRLSPRAPLTTRLAVAAGLAVAHTVLLAFMLHLDVWYAPRLLAFRLASALAYFFLLREGYGLLHDRLRFRYDKGHLQYGKYLKGLLLFVLFGLALYALVGLLPWTWFYGAARGVAFGVLELKMFTFINAVAAGLYFCVLSFFDIQRNLSHQQFRREKYQRERAQAQLETLKSQISPHFLFNSLNALSSLIYLDEDKAHRFVNELSGVFRYVLEHKDREVVALRTELAFLEAFYYLLTIRFRDNLKLHLEIPALYLDRTLPPLTLQLLVENAIKHNVVSRDEPLSIHLSVQEECLVVRNNLQLRQHRPASTGIGLRNIVRRYQYLTERPVAVVRTQTEFTARIPLLEPLPTP